MLHSVHGLVSKLSLLFGVIVHNGFLELFTKLWSQINSETENGNVGTENKTGTKK